MATQMTAPRKALAEPTHSPADPSIRAIISAARGKPARSPSRGAWGMAALTGALLWASFTPLDWGWLGWVALVPLILLIRTPVRSRWLYTAVYATSLASAVASLQWMRLGDPAMYYAWIALAAYVAIYLPVFVALCRVAVHRWNVPLTLAVPVAWTGLEFFRAHVMTGFSWYYLGHTQYRWIELIQVSDLVGAYGVSFIVALCSACLAGMLPLAWMERLRLFLPGVNALVMQAGEPGDLRTPRRQFVTLAACLAAFASVVGYGYVRRSQAAFVAGPTTALIQGNFTTSLKHDPNAAREIFNTHHRLTGKAVYPHHPDLIVWPETMYRAPLMSASPDLSNEDLARLVPGIPPEAWRESSVPQALADMAKQSGAAMVIGLDAMEVGEKGFRHYNSAAFVRPDTGYVGRYDKLHLVPFGEYLPLYREIPILRLLSPIPPEFSIAPGERARAFAWKEWRFAPIICFEDTVPHVVRGIVAARETDEPTLAVQPEDTVSPSASLPPGPSAPSRKVDVLVNLTNDGWFHGSSELDQHLITAAFRAVECRTPMVRAVNTGISAVIDGDGVIREPDVFLDGDGLGRDTFRDPKTGKWRKQLNASVISRVPLDNRTSLYVRWGDWFAAACGFGCVLVALSRLVPAGRKAVA